MEKDVCRLQLGDQIIFSLNQLHRELVKGPCIAAQINLFDRKAVLQVYCEAQFIVNAKQANVAILKSSIA